MQKLQPIYARFESRLDDCSSRFSVWLNDWNGRFDNTDRMFLEGLLSATWQYWCLFCRRVVVASALGCETAGGTVVAPCVSPARWERVSYIAQVVKSSGKVKPQSTNSTLRHEPTWGDVKKLIDVISAIKPDNESTLLTGFGGATKGPIHAQVFRNASAHRNHQTFADARKLMPFYVARKFQHPVEALLWEEPSSKDFAILAWIEEMRVVGGQAVQ